MRAWWLLPVVLLACKPADDGDSDGTDDQTEDGTEGTGDVVELTPTASATATIGAAGGEIATTDGLFRLSVPEGALTEDVAITISHDADGGVAILEPEGLTFAEPAQLWTPDPEDGALAVVGLHLTETDAEWVTYSRQIRGDEVGWSAEIDHFSVMISVVLASQDEQARIVQNVRAEEVTATGGLHTIVPPITREVGRPWMTTDKLTIPDVNLLMKAYVTTNRHIPNADQLISIPAGAFSATRIVTMNMIESLQFSTPDATRLPDTTGIIGDFGVRQQQYGLDGSPLFGTDWSWNFECKGPGEGASAVYLVGAIEAALFSEGQQFTVPVLEVLNADGPRQLYGGAVPAPEIKEISVLVGRTVKCDAPAAPPPAVSLSEDVQAAIVDAAIAISSAACTPHSTGVGCEVSAPMTTITSVSAVSLSLAPDAEERIAADWEDESDEPAIVGGEATYLAGGGLLTGEIDYYAVRVTFDEEVDWDNLPDAVHYAQYAVVLNSGATPDYASSPAYPEDFFIGSDTWIEVLLNGDGALSLKVTRAWDDFAVVEDPDVGVVFDGAEMFVLIGAGEVTGEIEGLWATSFVHDGTYGIGGGVWNGDVSWVGDDSPATFTFAPEVVVSE